MAQFYSVEWISFLALSPPTNSSKSNVHSGETLTGKATYYPNRLNGHRTSSGGTFRQNGNTAASNKLPVGTHVKVTNLKNGKSADVTVTDRGAKLGNHKIDLSKKAANEIGLTGLTPFGIPSLS